MSTPRRTGEPADPARQSHATTVRAGRSAGPEPSCASFVRPGSPAWRPAAELVRAEPQSIWASPYGQNPNPYGQPPQAPTPYGQQPYGTGFPVPPQGNFPAPQMPTERPKELDIAFWVIIAAGVLSVLGAVIGFDANLIRQQLATVPELDQQLQATGMSIDAFLSFLHTMIIVFSVISLAIYVLLAFMIRKGSNVARIFATVFAALSVFGLLGGTLLSILSILAGVVGVVFAWLRPASAYIAARRAARAAGYR